MKHFLILTGGLLLCLSLLLLLPPTSTTSALPEYAAQTGEPCSSCHISPSGGGARGPRGQAWVAASKPSVVPDLVSSLELLGVELWTDSEYFTVVEPAAEEQPFHVEPADARRLFQWLSQYDGN